MEYAISMSEGGKRVYPDDADVDSYLEKGLLCPKCKEPVYLRQGDIRKAYFAHFHATSSRQVEKCELRITAYSNSTETSILIKDKGQRLEIFQQHLLSMISVGEEKIVEDLKFNKWINSIQRDNNISANNLIKDCTQYLINNLQKIADKYIIPSSKIKDNLTMLQQQIALEAMDYLCVKSSLQLLEYLLYYSIYQVYKHQRDKLFKQQITNNDIDIICHHASRIILLNRWLDAFGNVKCNAENKINVIRIKKRNISPDYAQLPLPFVVYGGKKNNAPITYRLQVVETKLLKIEISTNTYKTVKGEKQVVKTPVMIITSGKGILKTELYELPLKSKFVFTSIINGKEKQFAFHSDVIINMALPYWIDNALNFVESNDITPSWLVVAKLWLLAQKQETDKIDEVHKSKPFTEDQWYTALIESHRLLPDNKQLTTAVAGIPESKKLALKNVLNSVVDVKTTIVDIVPNTPDDKQPDDAAIVVNPKPELTTNGIGKQITKLKSAYIHGVTKKVYDNRGGGYVNNVNSTKTKISTGVKLPESIQGKLDTSKLSKTFNLPDLEKLGKVYLKLNTDNTITLVNTNKHIPNKTIAYIIGWHYQDVPDPEFKNNTMKIKIFDWNYQDNLDPQYISDTLTNNINRF